MSHTEVRTWSSPILPAEELRLLNDVVPNGAERFFLEFEKNGESRRTLDLMVIESKIVDAKRGQIFAFILVLVGFVCGTITSIYANPFAGGAIAGFPIVGVASTFIYGRYAQRVERERKAQIVPQRPKDEQN